MFHPLVHCYCNNQGLVTLKPGARNYILIYCVDGRGPGVWSSSSAFPHTLAGSWSKAGQAGIRLVVQSTSNAGIAGSVEMAGIQYQPLMQLLKLQFFSEYHLIYTLFFLKYYFEMNFVTTILKLICSKETIFPFPLILPSSN